MKRFEGKNVVITGGARGIGRVAGCEFAKEGANILFVDINDMSDSKRDVERTGMKAFDFKCNLRNENEIVALGKKAGEIFNGNIDILVNNAGVGGKAQLVEEMKLEDWNNTLSVDLTGAMLVAREIIPYMKKNKTGNIVFTASNVARRGLPYRADYVCSKWAIIGLTQTLALELVDFNIRVNAVCPGPVSGDLIDEVVQFHAMSENREEKSIHEEWALAAPMKRYVEPEEVAKVMKFLCSDESSAMTGQALNITCGFIMT